MSGLIKKNEKLKLFFFVCSTRVCVATDIDPKVSNLCSIHGNRSQKIGLLQFHDTYH